MRRKQKKPPPGEHPKFPEPQLDSVDWAQKILYGSEKSRLLSIFEAKEKKDAAALPALIKQLPSMDELGTEAREALPVIIEANPGREEVFAVVPGLSKSFSNDMDGYFAVWTFARICESNPKKFRENGPKLLELAHEVIADSDGYFLEEIAICFGQMGFTEASVPLIKALDTMKMDLEVRMRIEKVLTELARQAYMH